jgi:hypothetical protein
MRRALVVLSMGLLACASGAQDASRQVDEETSAPTSGAATGDRAAARRTTPVPFVTPSGIEHVPLEVDGRGHLWMGDMGFGSITNPKPRSLAPSDPDLRWPDATVHFMVSPAVYNDPQCLPDELTSESLPYKCPVTTLRKATEYITAHVPQIKFVEIPFGGVIPPEGVLLVDHYDSPGGRADLGYQGPGGSLVEFSHGAPHGTFIHELGHVLGLKHEHMRFDRDAYLDICDVNAAAPGDFAKVQWPEYYELGPYDFSSRMHYMVGQNTSTTDPTQCGGFPLVLKPGVDTLPQPLQQTKLSGKDYSRGDINTLAMIYGEPLGIARAQDMFGTSIAVADFDRDGYDDIVVGTPGNNSMDLTASGAVFAYKGNTKSPTPWKLADPRPNATYEQNGLFGSALAVGDFDGDGWMDLAVGAPSTTAPGKVYLFRGGQFEGTKPFVDSMGNDACASDVECTGTQWAPLTFWKVLSTANAGADHPENGDGFGTALAVSNFDGDGRADLVVGAPKKGGSGRAYLFRGSSLVTASPSAMTITPSPSINGSEFGASITTGLFAGDTGPDIAIGAPVGTAGAGGGRVYIVEVRYVATVFMWTTSIVQVISPPTETDARFGSAVLGGPFFSSGFGSTLVIGAPRQTNNIGVKAGAIHFWGRNSGGGTLLSSKQVMPSGSAEQERLGTALAFVPAGPAATLAVGAPRNGAGKGRVVLLKSNSTGTAMQNWTNIFGESGIVNDDGELGKAFATGNVAARTPNAGQFTAHLFVGAPATRYLNEAAAGRVSAYTFGPSPSKVYDFGQQSRSPWAK